MKKAMVLVVCIALCVGLIACGTGGGAAREPLQVSGFVGGDLATGEWFVFDDSEGDGGSSTAQYVEIDVDGIPGIHVTGYVTTQFQWGFAGWGLDPDEETLALYRTARAFSFRILCDLGQRYAIKFKQSNVRDHAYHEFVFETVAGEVTLVEVPVQFFRQPPWTSNTVRFNQDLVTDIEFQTHESWRPGPFNVQFFDFRVHQ